MARDQSIRVRSVSMVTVLRRYAFNVALVLGALAILFGVLARLIYANRYALWEDEWATLAVSQGLSSSSIPTNVVFVRSELPAQRLGTILSANLNEETPPAFDLLLAAWTRGFGVTRWAVRFPSIVCGFLCLIGVWRFTSEISDRVGAIFATAFLAASPMAIDLSLEVRAYSLGALAALGSTWCLFRGIQSNGKWWWVGYSLLIALLAYCHYFALAIPAAHALGLAFCGPRSAWRPALGAYLGAALLYAPWLVMGLPRHWHGVGSVYRMFALRGLVGYSDPATPLNTIRALGYMGSSLLGVIPSKMGSSARVIAPVALGLMATVVLRGRGNARLRLLFLSGALPPLMLTFYTFLIARVLVPMGARHAFFGLPMLAILIGAAARAAPSEHAGGVGSFWTDTALSILLVVGGVNSYLLFADHDLKSRTSAVEWAAGEARSAPEALLIFGDVKDAVRFGAISRAEERQLVLPDGSISCERFPANETSILLVVRRSEPEPTCTSWRAEGAASDLTTAAYRLRRTADGGHRSY